MSKNNQPDPFYCAPNKPRIEKGIKEEKPKFWIWTSFETKNKPQNKSKTRFFALDRNVQGFFLAHKTKYRKIGILGCDNEINKLIKK